MKWILITTTTLFFCLVLGGLLITWCLSRKGMGGTFVYEKITYNKATKELCTTDGRKFDNLWERRELDFMKGKECFVLPDSLENQSFHLRLEGIAYSIDVYPNDSLGFRFVYNIK